MINFKERFYETLVIREKFYMKQYFSEFRNKDNFIAIKQLNDGIYCVLISDESEKNIDYNEAMQYIKTLEKPFSLNMIILSNKEDIESFNIANKMIVNKNDLSIISCDESCSPLQIILNNIIEYNNVKKESYEDKFSKNNKLTFCLIGINIVIFLITEILSGYTFEIDPYVLSLGSKYNSLIQQGEIWRLLTCAFLHANIIHLTCNMYSLYVIGPQIQQIYDTKKYLIIYIISCITSSLLSYFASPYSSVGASGAIFGLMGALLAFVIIERKKLNRRYISSIFQVIVINLFIGLSLKNIDNFAHIGGLLGGLVSGYIFYKFIQRKSNKIK